MRVVVLRGSGRHFCTGADLASRGAGAAAAAEPAKPPATLRDVLVALDTLPKPTIAVVHGGAVGGGAAFAACCDVALATDAAFFSIPEVRVGMPPLGVMPFLIRAMGHRNFRRYGLSGERIAAAEALRHRPRAPGLRRGNARRHARRASPTTLLHGAPGALAELKSAAAQFASPTLAAILAHQRAAQSEDRRRRSKAVTSFREKRKPNWYPQ